MIIDILTLFPDPVAGILNSSILRRAQAGGNLELKATDLRQFSDAGYRSVDDTPFGGGPGMLFRADILEKALQDQLSKVNGKRSDLLIIYPSPRGLKLEQSFVQSLADWIVGQEGSAFGTEDSTQLDPAKKSPRRICVLAGRYEGIDERILLKWVDLEISLGDFVLTGGEIPALALVDAIVRWIPGSLGKAESAETESFSEGLLEYPQFTKPREYAGMEVPEVLLGGNHQAISDFKLKQSLLVTYAFRPDLIRKHPGGGLPSWARELLEDLKRKCDLRA